MESSHTPPDWEKKFADMLDWHLSPIAGKLDEMALQTSKSLKELQVIGSESLREVVRHLDEIDLKTLRLQRSLGQLANQPIQSDLTEHEEMIPPAKNNTAIKPSFSKNERAQRAFKRAAFVLFEAWEEGWGHTRLLDEPLISDHLVEVGRSLKGTERREHVIPLKLIYDHCEQLFDSGASVQSVAEFLARHVKIVRISDTERELIDQTLKLKTKMPEGWTFDDPHADIYARLVLGGVKWKPLND